MTIKDPQNLEMTEFGALVETADGSFTIRHSEHGQDFHSSEGARFEAWELYVVASGLLAQLTHDHRHPVTVLDVGMGLAYNACATIAAWLEGPGSAGLQLLSLEIDRKLVEALANGKAHWMRGWSGDWTAGPARLKQLSESKWMAEIHHPKSGHLLSWTILVGDATTFDLNDLPAMLGIKGFQYIWQDPFTPELNPTMWSVNWFRKVKEISLPDSKLMTYSVSRVVKDALSEAGWIPERFRTPGKKRHWLRASFS